MVDENNFRMGVSASGLLPVFRAADAMACETTNGVEWPNIDVVTDRNNLRRLLSWLRPDAGEWPSKEFRIDVQLGGKKTLLLHRFEECTREMASKPPRCGCGINFERESTIPAAGCERGAGHHRVIRYVSKCLKPARRPGLMLVMAGIRGAQVCCPFLGRRMSFRCFIVYPQSVLSKVSHHVSSTNPRRQPRKPYRQAIQSQLLYSFNVICRRTEDT